MKKSKAPTAVTVPFRMVGSTVYGRYPKISSEQTWNMFISDGFLVPYAGYQVSAELIDTGFGRGIFSSTRGNRMIVVISSRVFSIDQNLNFVEVGSLSTFQGDVFIDENDNNQIAICDKQNLYIYNYITPSFTTVALDFKPGYVSFQDGYFIAPDITSNIGNSEWRLSALNDGTSWPSGANNVGSFQTKPDQPVACIRFPGRGNMLFVMGSNVTEVWYDVGAFPFPYQRSSSYNIDYGCINPATIDGQDNLVVWLGQNEKSGPTILYSTGGDVNQISNDGINYRFANLVNPHLCYGFLFKQDGHLFYQLTFPDPQDNISFTFDFNEKKFYCLSDEDMNRHIAKRVTFFNGNYYFVSLIDGNLYEFDTIFTNYNYGNGRIFEIPRVRVTDTIRLPNNTPAVISSVTFEIEQGVTDPTLYPPNANKVPKASLSISKNGGQSFGSYANYNLNPLGVYQGLVKFWNLGYTKEFTQQYRFWSLGRVVVGDGTVEIYQ